jgi:hypothetical protein
MGNSNLEFKIVPLKLEAIASQFQIANFKFQIEIPSIYLNLKSEI